MLRRGPELVRAKRLSANLTEDESGLTFVRAHVERRAAGLAGSGASPTASVVRFTGRDLAVAVPARPENQARKVELDGGENAKASSRRSAPARPA